MRIKNCQWGHWTYAFDPKTCTKVQQVFENVMLLSSIASRFIYIILSHQTIQGLPKLLKSDGGGEGKATKS